MKLNIQKTVKAQSILEYLLVLSAILIAIIVNTVGFHSGVQNSLDLQKGLNTIQDGFSEGILVTEAPQKVTGQSYYTPARDHTSDQGWDNNIDTYGGPDYTGGYNYDEWVRSNPNSAYNAPKAGTIIGSTTGNAN